MTTYLYNRTCYSILESTLRLEQLVQFSKSQNIKNVGITDRSLFAGMNFYKLCKANDLNPILGQEIQIEIEERKYSFLIYPINNQGYLDLISFNRVLNPSITELSKLTKDCYVVCNYIDGYLISVYKNNQVEKITPFLSEFNDNLLIGLAPNNNPYYADFNKYMISISQTTNHSCIALYQVLYATKEEFDSYKVEIAIHYGTTVFDDRLVFNPNAYLLTENEFKQLFSQEIIEKTDALFNKINLHIDEIRTDLPTYPTPDGSNPKDYLVHLCNAGLNKRLNGNITKEYVNRLNYELEVINKMNFANYFLVIYDVISHARKANIYVGPGRGSAVGSLVAYCLGITHFNPLQYDLYFERFLNPERISLPDIDLDIPDEAREDIIEYVKGKYGENHVGHIITFGTLAARTALRDVGKALNISDTNISIMLKALPQDAKIKLNDAYNNFKEFKTVVNASDDNKRLFEIALKLEGLPRNSSTHASGIVVSNKPLDEVLPIIDDGNSISTQYTMEYLEELGLVKLDFLGLKNLSIISSISKLVWPDLAFKDLLKMPIDNQKTYELICNNNTAGIFQLDKATAKNVIKAIQPKCFEDIAVILAIMRPGPLSYLDQYCKNKANPNSIQYLHPDFKSILQKTNGIIIYQEQIMEIAVKIAGFSLAKADNLRKAISKKKIDLMNALENDFIQGSISKGYNQQIAKSSFETIKKFADYGFNKSHAIAYSFIAYQLAYFKANYPLQFYVSLLNSELGETTALNEFVVECKKNGIALLPPDINKSEALFTIENNAIRFPLTSIRKASSITCRNILNDREKNGQFKDFFEFFARTMLKENKKTYESFVYSGCLDCFCLNRTTLINEYEKAKQYATISAIENGEQIRFDFSIVEKPMLTNWHDNKEELDQFQHEALGVYLNNFPTETYRKNYANTIYSNQIEDNMGYCSLIGLIMSIKEHKTKNGDLMCFVSCNDEFADFDITFMPKQYQQYKNILKKGNIIYIEGNKDNFSSVKVNSITLLKGV